MPLETMEFPPGRKQSPLFTMSPAVCTQMLAGFSFSGGENRAKAVNTRLPAKQRHVVCCVLCACVLCGICCVMCASVLVYCVLCAVCFCATIHTACHTAGAWSCTNSLRKEAEFSESHFLSPRKGALCACHRLNLKHSPAVRLQLLLS